MTFEIVSTELVIKRINTVHGVELLNYDLNKLEIVADNVIEEWSEHYHNGDGDFGSSDMTYLIKEVIDDYIMNNDLNLETKFLPELTIL